MHLSLLVRRFVPTKVIRVRNKVKPGLIMTAGLHSTSCRGPISGGLVIALEFTGMSLSITRGGPVSDSDSDSEGESSSDSSLPPLIWAGGGLVCELVGKADMLSAHFDGKQSRYPVDLPSTCHPSPSLTTFAFRSREVKRLLLDLDSYGGTDPL